MLYRTHPHSLFTSFNPSPHTPHLPSPSPRIQAMETLNGGVLPENKPAAFEEDFFVDELLDFSNGFSETEEHAPPQPEVNQNEAKKACSVFPEENKPKKFDFGLLPESELMVPEGLESLEWLSHFTEDSFPDCTLTGNLPSENRSKPVSTAQEPSCFESPVQTKARTKRARTGVRVWPVLSTSFSEPSTSSSSSTSSTTSFSPNTLWPYTNQTDESFMGKPLFKKQKKKTAAAGGGGVAAPPRRCSHCGVTKTPQWRAGPLGSKTLCNACGVRFKSGRLFPEYRPACSPTFSTELHSNNHRKVLEMRRQRESEVDETGLTLPPPVQGFLKSY